jgi:hypothetical protein
MARADEGAERRMRRIDPDRTARPGPPSGLPRTLALALAFGLALACGRSDTTLVLLEPDFAGGRANLFIQLGADLDPGSLRVWLNGARIEALFAPAPGGLAASVVVEPGPYVLVARAKRAEPPRRAVGDVLQFDAPPRAPALASSDPPAGAGGVPRTAWLRLDFESALPPGAESTFGLTCGGAAVPFALEALAAGPVIVNPDPELPPAADCLLAWSGPGGVASLAFATAAVGPAVEVLHDRTQAERLAPLPDDFFLVDDASTATGQLVELPLPDRPPLVQALFGALLGDVNALDGWSPLAPIVIEVSDALDPASLPRTPAESLDPLASAALVDLGSGPGRGARVPFRIDVRADATPFGEGHVLMVWPSVPLAPGGHYAFAISRRALADPTRPLDPSAFFAAALAAPVAGEAPEVARTRDRIAPLLALLETEAAPRLPREDLALALPISVRSTDSLPADPLAMRAQVHADPPPALLGWLAQADPSASSPIAAIVRGTWDAPDWRVRSPSLPGGAAANVTRDGDGLPVQQTTRPVEFVLALPQAALTGPVPVIVHQHGNPGSADEVISTARNFLAPAGFAVIGFTDILNREIATPTKPNGTPRTDEERIEAQVLNVFGNLFANGTLPDHWLETTAEQLAFLRFVQSLGDLDVLPLGAPDGLPDLDLALPLSYHGISEGGNNGQALVPYAPELRAAALVVGGARLAETLVHQQAQLFLEQVPAFVPGLVPAEVWVGVSLFQMGFDRQDRQSHLAFAFQRPVEVDGTTRKASVLLIEGLDDSLVPNHATDSAAFVLGVPHLAPVQWLVPFLPAATGPLRANLGPETTGAFFQYVPTGVDGIPPTPGCLALSPSSASEGHYCAQSAAESRAQRVDFFQSALAGVPEIASPF